MARLLRRKDLFPAQALHAAYVMDEPGDYAFYEHRHRDFCEWTLVVRGRLHQEINGHPVVLEAGDLIFIRETDRHSLAGSDLSFTNCTVDLEAQHAVAAACGEEAWLAEVEAAPLPPVIHPAPARRRHLERLLIRAGTNRTRRCATTELVAALLDACTEAEIPEAAPPWLGRLLAVIDERLEETVVVADLPELCDRDPAHIARSFRRCFRCTPSTWLNRRRMARAADLLVGTGRALVDITYSLGYSSQSYFNRCFKAVHGISPGRYRERHARPGV